MRGQKPLPAPPRIRLSSQAGESADRKALVGDDARDRRLPCGLASFIATPSRDTRVSLEGGEMHVEADPTQTQPQTGSVEPRREQLRRHGRRTALYAWAFGLVALLVVLIALVIANTRQVKLSWAVGSAHASLVWIILASAVLGWLLGIVTSVVFRSRTRRRSSAG